MAQNAASPLACGMSSVAASCPSLGATPSNPPGIMPRSPRSSMPAVLASPRSVHTPRSVQTPRKSMGTPMSVMSTPRARSPARPRSPLPAGRSPLAVRTAPGTPQAAALGSMRLPPGSPAALGAHPCLLSPRLQHGVNLDGRSPSSLKNAVAHGLSTPSPSLRSPSPMVSPRSPRSPELSDYRNDDGHFRFFPIPETALEEALAVNPAGTNSRKDPMVELAMISMAGPLFGALKSPRCGPSDASSEKSSGLVYHDVQPVAQGLRTPTSGGWREPRVGETFWNSSASGYIPPPPAPPARMQQCRSHFTNAAFAAHDCKGDTSSAATSLSHSEVKDLCGELRKQMVQFPHQPKGKPSAKLQESFLAHQDLGVAPFLFKTARADQDHARREAMATLASQMAPSKHLDKGRLLEL